MMLTSLSTLGKGCASPLTSEVANPGPVEEVVEEVIGMVGHG
jgi:hypothetical protein